VHGSLERVVASGDPAARRELSLGSHLAGAAFSLSGLGAVHALASTLGGLTDRPHGTCLAASIRVGLEFNRPDREAEYAEVARSLGVNEQDGRDNGSDPATSAEDLLAECDRLRSAIGLPGSFTAVGLDRSGTDEIVANTLLQERRLATNLRAVSEVALRETVLAAFE
jgi:alcohol dehydrogenase class IV